MMRNESRPQDQTITPKPPAEAGDEPGVYVHEPAGIRERSGSVPAWLKLIALGLILWGLYYTIRFWSSD
jgi:hypothetical protein